RQPGSLDLADPVHGVHVENANVPDLLDRFLDLCLVRSRVDEERVGVALQARVGLLRDDRPDHDVARALHSWTSSPELGSRPSRTSRASAVNNTWSASRTS